LKYVKNNEMTDLWAQEASATLQSMVALIHNRGIRNPQILHALETVPRNRFVTQHYLSEAFGDHPLPIGAGQTISQPYIVALMTDALGLSAGERVLEIGTGSGYQAAILAAMGLEVYTVERIPELHTQANAVLQALDYNVHCRLSDGYDGWPEYAPYAGILVTAAALAAPPPLLEQLADGGRMVIPIGPPGGYQTLWKFVKEGAQLHRINLGGVAFVPFIHA